jgi:hypothetical protein
MVNKLLLLAIALGLWANALSGWVKPARADSESSLSSIEDYVSAIASGTCNNSKIC